MNADSAADHAARDRLDRLVDGQLRAQHDGDLEAIVASMAPGVVYDVVGADDNPIQGIAAVRHRYRELVGSTLHERDVPVRRLYGPDFVLDEHLWQGRVIGRAFGHDGRGRWLSHRELCLLEVRDDRIVRQTIWNDAAAIGRQLP